MGDLPKAAALVNQLLSGMMPLMGEITTGVNEPATEDPDKTKWGQHFGSQR
jgi:hypothetical protein